MNLEKNYLVQELFQIYRNLLTEHQQNVFESYYFDNLSLSEIAENFSISRQGVKDILDRCEKSLKNFEDSLLLYKKNAKIISSLEGKISRKNLEEIKNIIYKRN